MSKRTDLDVALERVAGYVSRYVILGKAELTAVTLWTAHTHAIDAAYATPYLSITSAEKESGKTRLLEVLALVVSSPWLTGRVTSAVLVRKVDKAKPTLLLDESDATFNGDQEYAETLRGILNSGYLRSGKASVCVGQGAKLTYADLSTFCPKAIAGLGHLPDTVASRSIPIRLKRKAPGESVERFRQRDVEEESEPLRLALAALTEQNIGRLEDAQPEIPDALGDRQADCWEPLFAIAELAGGEWPQQTRDAALELSGRGVKADDSIGVRLLADLRHAFSEDDRLSTRDVIDKLAEDEEAPWATWHKGSRISPRKLAELLSPFGIHSRTIRLSGETPKGYVRDDFEDAWTRYLPPLPPGNKRHNATTRMDTGKTTDSYPPHDPPCGGSEEAGNPHEQTDVALWRIERGDGGEGRSKAAGNGAEEEPRTWLATASMDELREQYE